MTTSGFSELCGGVSNRSRRSTLKRGSFVIAQRRKQCSASPRNSDSAQEAASSAPSVICYTEKTG
jgi:hypothetical protein